MAGYWLVYKEHPLSNEFGIHQRYAAAEQEQAAQDTEALKQAYPQYRVELLRLAADGYPVAYWARISSLWSFEDRPLKAKEGAL